METKPSLKRSSDLTKTYNSKSSPAMVRPHQRSRSRGLHRTSVNETVNVCQQLQIVALLGSKFTTCWKKFHKWQHDEIHPECMNLRALSLLLLLLLLLLLFELSSSVALDVETLAKPNHLMFHNVDRQSTLRPQRAEAPWLQRVAGIFQIDGTGMGRSYLYLTWENPSNPTLPDKKNYETRIDMFGEEAQCT